MASIRQKQKIPGVPVGAARCRIDDPRTCGKQQTKNKKNGGVPVGAALCRIDDPRTCGKHPIKNKKIPGAPVGAAGCRIQDPRTCGKHHIKLKKFLLHQLGLVLQGAEFRGLIVLSIVDPAHVISLAFFLTGRWTLHGRTTLQVRGIEWNFGRSGDTAARPSIARARNIRQA